jgi:hypothetical protein
MHMGNSISAAAEKRREFRVFQEFIQASGLPIDPATVENRSPPEPDIRGIIRRNGPVAFEIVAIRNPELAKDIGDQRKRGTQAKFLMFNDPTKSGFLSKLGKACRTDAPVTRGEPSFRTISA